MTRRAGARAMPPSPSAMPCGERQARDRRCAGSSLLSFRAVRLLGAAKALHHQFLCVLRFHAQTGGQLVDAASLEVTKAQDLTVTGRERRQRLAGAKLIGKSADV